MYCCVTVLCRHDTNLLWALPRFIRCQQIVKTWPGKITAVQFKQYGIGVKAASCYILPNSYIVFNGIPSSTQSVTKLQQRSHSSISLFSFTDTPMAYNIIHPLPVCCYKVLVASSHLAAFSWSQLALFTPSTASLDHAL